MATDGFRREATSIDTRLLIKSVCIFCGFEIVDSVTQNLEKRESEHRESCPKASATKASNRSS